MPPESLGQLARLAWSIGRDDAAAGLPPVRCLTYRTNWAHQYLDGYEAQRALETGGRVTALKVELDRIKNGSPHLSTMTPEASVLLRAAAAAPEMQP